MSRHKQLMKLIQCHHGLSLWGYWRVNMVGELILVAQAAVSAQQTAKWASSASARSLRFACTDLKLIPAMAFSPFCTNIEQQGCLETSVMTPCSKQGHLTLGCSWPGSMDISKEIHSTNHKIWMPIVQLKTQSMRPEFSFRSAALPSFYSALT